MHSQGLLVVHSAGQICVTPMRTKRRADLLPGATIYTAPKMPLITREMPQKQTKTPRVGYLSRRITATFDMKKKSSTADDQWAEIHLFRRFQITCGNIHRIFTIFANNICTRCERQKLAISRASRKSHWKPRVIVFVNWVFLFKQRLNTCIMWTKEPSYALAYRCVAGGMILSENWYNEPVRIKVLPSKVVPIVFGE